MYLSLFFFVCFKCVDCMSLVSHGQHWQTEEAFTLDLQQVYSVICVAERYHNRSFCKNTRCYSAKRCKCLIMNYSSQWCTRQSLAGIRCCACWERKKRWAQAIDLVFMLLFESISVESVWVDGWWVKQGKVRWALTEERHILELKWGQKAGVGPSLN